MSFNTKLQSSSSGVAGVVSLNSLVGVVTLSAGTNISFVISGNNIQINSTGGGGTPSAPVNGIQYNNAGVFGADSNFVRNPLNQDTTIKADNGSGNSAQLFLSHTGTSFFGVSNKYKVSNSDDTQTGFVYNAMDQTVDIGDTSFNTTGIDFQVDIANSLFKFSTDGKFVVADTAGDELFSIDSPNTIALIGTGIAYKTDVFTGTNTVQTSGYVHFADTSSGAVVFNLLPVNSINKGGETFYFHDYSGNAGLFNISIVPNGTDTINFGGTLTITQDGGGYMLVSDGSNNWTATYLPGGPLTGTVYPNHQLVFGDGSTFGGVTSSSITWDESNHKFIVGKSTNNFLEIDGDAGTSFIQTGTSFMVRDLSGGIVLYAQNDGGTHRVRSGDISGIYKKTVFDVNDNSQQIIGTTDGNVIFKDTTNNKYFSASANGGNPIITLGADGYGNGTKLTIDDTSQATYISGFGTVASDRIALFDNANRVAKIGDVDNDFNGTLLSVNDSTSVINLTGGIANKIRFVSTSTDTVLASDYCILIASVGGGTTENLPVATIGAGTTYVFKDWHNGAGTNNITLLPNGADTIDLAASYVISVNGGSITLISDGISNWSVI